MGVKRGGLGKGLDSLIPDNGKVPESGRKTKVVEKVIEKIVEKPSEVKLGRAVYFRKNAQAGARPAPDRG